MRQQHNGLGKLSPKRIRLPLLRASNRLSWERRILLLLIELIAMWHQVTPS